MASVDGSRSLEGSSDEIITNQCGPCNYGGSKKEATHYCSQCDDLLCRTCAESRPGHKSFRHHKLKSVKELSTNTPKISSLCIVFCDCSQNNEVTLYCEDHSDVLP